MIETNKHILIVTSEFPPQPGGIGNHSYNLAKQLSKNNFKVKVIADQRSESGKEENDFDKKKDFKILRIALKNFRVKMYFKRIAFLFKETKTSDVVIASGKFSLWIVALVSIFYKRKYVAVIHGSEVNFTNKVLKGSINLSLNRFSKVIAVSNYTKSLVAHIHKNIVVIPNGIDIDKFKLESIPEIKIKGYPKLVTVGNVTDRKGQLNVIKKIPELLNEYPDLHYHCVGLPTQKDAFIEIAKELKVANYVTFHGRVTEQELIAYLKASDIFVMLSSPTNSGDVEGFGIALIEANYFNLPCIGANGCGIEDAIEDYKSGRLITYNDTKAFKDAISEVLTNYEMYKRKSNDWAKNHNWEIIIKKYIKEIF